MLFTNSSNYFTVYMRNSIENVFTYLNYQKKKTNDNLSLYQILKQRFYFLFIFFLYIFIQFEFNSLVFFIHHS